MIGYNMPYMGNPSLQSIDTIIQETQNKLDNFKQQKEQFLRNMQQTPMQQPTNLTQNFQLASNNNGNIRLVNGIEDVQKEIVLTDTYFISNSLDGLWIKNPRGDIRTFELFEIKPKDEKDLLIEKLQKQINDLTGGNRNAGEFNESNGELLRQQSNSGDDSEFREPIAENKSSTVSNISNSKTTKRKS